MRIANPKFLLLPAALGLALACSLMMEFDYNGKPCSNGAACRAGYVCDSNNKCQKDTGQVDAGPVVCGGRCTADQVCLENRQECVDKGCATQACPAGQACYYDSAGKTICHPLLGQMGSLCSSDGECAAGRICMVSSVPDSSGNKTHAGFCTKTCKLESDCQDAADAGTTSTENVGCFDLGGSARYCAVIPKDAKTPRAAQFQCNNEKSCADFPGYTCALFDRRGPNANSSSIEDPLWLCDKAREGAAPAILEECDVNETAGGKVAANGLCLPGHALALAPDGGVSAVSYATVRCTGAADCIGGVCGAAEYALFTDTGARNSAPRSLKVCLKGASGARCDRCMRDYECKADAPHCLVNPDAGYGECTSECQIISGASSGHSYVGCPAGVTCEQFASGSKCVTTGCP